VRVKKRWVRLMFSENLEAKWAGSGQAVRRFANGGSDGILHPRRKHPYDGA